MNVPTRSFWHITPRWLLVVFVLLAVTACSGNFFYNRLDYLVPWYIDGYVDLSSAQRTLLKKDLEPLLLWHREEELTQYAQFIAEVEIELGEDLSADVMQGWVDFGLAAYSRLLTRFQPVLLDLATELSAAQIEQLIGKLHEGQHEEEQEFLQRTRVEYDEENYENVMDGLEDWLGRLDKSQRSLVRTATARLERYDQLWLNDRAIWIDKIAGLLAARAPGWREELAAVMKARGDYSSRPYAEVSTRNQATLTEAVISVLNSRSGAQDKKFRKKLAEWRRRFENLQSI